MLVILTEEQILSPQKVCPTCLMADQSGSPRWHHGKLFCGHALQKSEERQATIYECQMGFRIANIQ
ncbi:hypothetical protein Sta7437_1011 [Stanieria cyanosphaera PCC 7437]|uniref:Uncharacterized protein n=1 Tax=Stanieria cyanosphaera (strain ATCC 29371 / PCC 7437) TaxID=111780 RepID=K9XRB9_STAC7|nr:hypothetical protein [Stanieria cyanosphaera]AFZ34591.1 hypothetical protein Sta7437_1011 [Stanieria cyanosphaera PCC 7437]